MECSQLKPVQGTPLRLITSSVAIKQQWLTLDYWACPLNNSPKDSGVKKTTGWKKQNEIIKTLWLLFMDEFQLLQGYSYFEKAVHFITLSSQKLMVLILSTSEGWKAESTLDTPNSFEHETPGWEIQHLNHYAMRFTPSFPKCLVEKMRTIQHAVQ